MNIVWRIPFTKTKVQVVGSWPKHLDLLSPLDFRRISFDDGGNFTLIRFLIPEWAMAIHTFKDHEDAAIDWRQVPDLD